MSYERVGKGRKRVLRKRWEKVGLDTGGASTTSNSSNSSDTDNTSDTSRFSRFSEDFLGRERDPYREDPLGSRVLSTEFALIRGAIFFERLPPPRGGGQFQNCRERFQKVHCFFMENRPGDFQKSSLHPYSVQ